MNAPKRHHYLPQCYLEGFTAADGLLEVFDRKKKEFRRQHPKVTCTVNDFNTIFREDGSKNLSIEQFFSNVEGNSKMAIRKLILREPLTRTDREWIAVFVAYQHTRVPDFQKGFEELSEHAIIMLYDREFGSGEKVKKWMAEREQSTGKKSSMTPEAFAKLVRDNFTVDFDRQHTFKAMVETAKTFANCFMQMNWCVFRPEAGSAFITTDSPFIVLPPPELIDESIGILTPGAGKMIALTNQLCLVMGDHGSEFADVTWNKAQVRFFNVNAAFESDRFLIAHDRALLDDIVGQTKAGDWRKGKRIIFPQPPPRQPSTS